MSARERRDAERAKLRELIAVSEAERTVADVRMTGLAAAQQCAWRQHNAAKGLVTRARKDGSAEKIAAAVERERKAYAEFDRISGEVIKEVFEINRARLESLGALNDQMSRAWDADAAVLDEITGRRDREAE